MTSLIDRNLIKLLVESDGTGKSLVGAIYLILIKEFIGFIIVGLLASLCFVILIVEIQVIDMIKYSCHKCKYGR